MYRVKLNISESTPQFTTKMQVRVTDINYGNHLANDKLAGFLHEARVQMLASLGYKEFDLEGVGLIQADVMVRYLAEAFLGEMLTLHLYVEHFTSRSFDMMYRIVTQRDGKETVIALAKVGLVCFDYTSKTMVNVPEAFKQRFN